MLEYYSQLSGDLNKLGYLKKVHHLKSIREVRDAVKAKVRIDLLFCDNNLPDGKGSEVIQEIRSFSRYKKTRILMCTTTDEVESILSAINNGANDYMVKPWTYKELYTKVSTEISKL